MKILFFIAALAGAVYLIIQTPAGKAWLHQSEPSTQVAQSLENKMTEFAQRLNQKQQAQINQLESRIAELEKERITVPSVKEFVPDSPAPLAIAADENLQRKRQARLQDIAQKMEMSSLQALVN